MAAPFFLLASFSDPHKIIEMVTFIGVVIWVSRTPQSTLTLVFLMGEVANFRVMRSQIRAGVVLLDLLLAGVHNNIVYRFVDLCSIPLPLRSLATRFLPIGVGGTVILALILHHPSIPFVVGKFVPQILIFFIEFGYLVPDKRARNLVVLGTVHFFTSPGFHLLTVIIPIRIITLTRRNYFYLDIWRASLFIWFLDSVRIVGISISISFVVVQRSLVMISRSILSRSVLPWTHVLIFLMFLEVNISIFYWSSRIFGWIPIFFI